MCYWAGLCPSRQLIPGPGLGSREQSLGWRPFVPEQLLYPGMMCSRGALNLLAALQLSPDIFEGTLPPGLQQAHAVFLWELGFCRA